PNRYYESVRGMSPSVLPNIADSNRFFPITENVRQVDWHGGFTAGAGSALYTARTYPKHYWNKTAFVAEPTGHLVATFTLHPEGTDFHSHNAWNLVASDDDWTSPILAEVGPDGQVWVIDWYNFIVQHNRPPRATGPARARRTRPRCETRRTGGSTGSSRRTASRAISRGCRRTTPRDWSRHSGTTTCS